MTVEYIQVAGKSNIYLGFPGDNYASLLKIGEQMDETSLTVQNFDHDVPGDRHGGAQGPPIERQRLGMMVSGQFALSRWSQQARRLMIAHGVTSTEGRLADQEIGSLLIRDRSFRLVIAPSKPNPIPFGLDSQGQDYFFYNFPAALVSGPIETGQGTKFSVLRFSMEAHRVPEGHPYADFGGSGNGVGVIWNRDSFLVPGWNGGALVT